MNSILFKVTIFIAWPLLAILLLAMFVLMFCGIWVSIPFGRWRKVDGKWKCEFPFGRES